MPRRDHGRGSELKPVERATDELAISPAPRIPVAAEREGPTTPNQGATPALVLGTLALLLMFVFFPAGALLGPIAVVLGVRGLARARRTGRRNGVGLALGAILGGVATAFSIACFVLLPGVFNEVDARGPHADACVIVSQRDATALFGGHRATNDASHGDGSSCIYRAKSARLAYYLDVSVTIGTRQFESAPETSTPTPVVGLGDRGFAEGSDFRSRVVFVYKNQTVDLVYEADSVGRGRRPTRIPFDVSRARPQLIALARSAAAHM